jgi:hypothetical protein
MGVEAFYLLPVCNSSESNDAKSARFGLREMNESRLIAYEGDQNRAAWDFRGAHSET